MSQPTIIVSRGDWLGNPANFRGPFYYFALRGWIAPSRDNDPVQNQNNMADMNKLFFFGDDFDAVLDILETEEELEEQFTEAVDSLSVKEAWQTLYRSLNSCILH